MSVNDPRIDVLLERYNAMQLRKEREYANRNRSYVGVSRAGQPMRFCIFLNRLERAHSAGCRFAVHTARVHHALLSPVAQFLLEVA